MVRITKISDLSEKSGEENFFELIKNFSREKKLMEKHLNPN
jgi:hypothetical protein